MKFEHVLQIYWSKGFLYNGRVVPFDTTLRTFFYNSGSIGRSTKRQLLNRFELFALANIPRSSFIACPRETTKSINIFLSQLSSVNNQVSEVNRYNLIRLYLLKTYRGRAHAIGKPSRGQRTWSNAWTAYHTNKTTRVFVATIQRTLQKNKKVTKIDYKKLQKRTRNAPTKVSLVEKKKIKNVWF